MGSHQASNEQQQANAAYIRFIQTIHSKWSPHPAQVTIGKDLIQGRVKEVFAQCGRNLGKTELMVYLMWRYALTYPSSENYYFAPFAKQAREILWASRRLQDFMPGEYVADIGEQQMRITLHNGSFIKLDGSDNVEAYRGVKPKGLSVFDEFKDFRPEFYEAYDPNRAAHDSPLLIIGTPPDRECQYTEIAEDFRRHPQKRWYKFPTSANPHISRQWLEDKKAELIARGDLDVWMREYEAEFIKGGKAKIFPMLKESHKRPHEAVIKEIKRGRKKLLWYSFADPAAASCFANLMIAINPFNRKVYCLDEIYETDQAKMTVKTIGKRIIDQREDLYDEPIQWRMGYDEAEKWFANEMLDWFEESFEPSQKAQNDKESGLTLIKDLLLTNQIIISDRCEKLFWELDNYFKDKNGKIPKGNDHLIDCIAKGELIATSTGMTPIENVKVGDSVMTRGGFRRVTDAWRVGKRDTVRLVFSDGKILRCTPEHRVYTLNRGFIAADVLSYEDSIVTYEQCRKRLILMGSNTAVTQTTIKKTCESTIDAARVREQDICTEQSTSTITEKFRTAIMSTTRTATHTIMRLKTWSASLVMSTISFTVRSVLLRQVQKSRRFYWKKYAHLLRNGIAQAMGWHGIQSMERPCLAGGIEAKLRLSAQNAPRSLCQTNSVDTGQSIALMLANLWQGADRAKITNPGHVRTALRPTSLAVTQEALHAQGNAVRLLRREAADPTDVYDISVHGDEEFFASGVLVHNCLRYCLGADHYTIQGEAQKEIEEEESWHSDKLRMHYSLTGLEGKFGADPNNDDDWG